jgi:hypothetical protein
VPLNLEDAKKDLDVAFKQEFDQLLLSWCMRINILIMNLGLGDLPRL